MLRRRLLTLIGLVCLVTLAWACSGGPAVQGRWEARDRELALEFSGADRVTLFQEGREFSGTYEILNNGLLRLQVTGDFGLQTFELPYRLEDDVLYIKISGPEIPLYRASGQAQTNPTQKSEGPVGAEIIATPDLAALQTQVALAQSALAAPGNAATQTAAEKVLTSSGAILTQVAGTSATEQAGYAAATAAAQQALAQSCTERVRGQVQAGDYSALVPGANLAGCDLRDLNLFGLDLSRADLTNADLRGANLKDTRLAGATLRHTLFSLDTLQQADKTGLDVGEASLIVSPEAIGLHKSVSIMAWSPDGRYLALSTRGLMLLIMDLQQVTWITIQLGDSASETAANLAWAPDSQRLAVCSATPTGRQFCHVYEAATGTRLAEIKINAADGNAVAWSPDGIRLAIGRFGGKGLAIWEPASGTLVSELPANAEPLSLVRNVRWLDDDLVFSTLDEQLVQWDLNSGSITPVWTKEANTRFDISWDINSYRYVIRTENRQNIDFEYTYYVGDIGIAELGPATVIKDVEWRQAQSGSLAIAPGGLYFLSGGVLFDAQILKAVARYVPQIDRPIGAELVWTAWSPTGTRFAAYGGGRDNLLVICQAPSDAPPGPCYFQDE